MTDIDTDASVDVDMLAHEPVEGAHTPEGPHSHEKIIATSTDAVQRGIEPGSTTMQFDTLPTSLHKSPSHGSPSHAALRVPFSAFGEVYQEKAVKRNGLAVIVPPVQNRWEYKVFQDEDEVEEILEEYDDAGLLEYLVLFADGSEDVVSATTAYLSLNTHYLDCFYINPCTLPQFPTVSFNAFVCMPFQRTVPSFPRTDSTRHWFSHLFSSPTSTAFFAGVLQ